jgi:hypothetical protein
MEDKNKKKKKKTIKHFYSKKETEKKHKFWKTQLVPQFNEKLSIELGPIKEEFKDEDIRKTPYELPEELEWVDIDITKEEELIKIYDFLNLFYYEITDYKEQYNKEFLRWQFSPIKNSQHKNILISIQKNKNLIQINNHLLQGKMYQITEVLFPEYNLEHIIAPLITPCHLLNHTMQEKHMHYFFLFL